MATQVIEIWTFSFSSKANTVANNEHSLRRVFVFVRRTPPNNVRQCSCSLKMFALAKLGP